MLLAKVSNSRSIALADAFSGIAATLLDSGKTTHAAFKRPPNLVKLAEVPPTDVRLEFLRGNFMKNAVLRTYLIPLPKKEMEKFRHLLPHSSYTA